MECRVEYDYQAQEPDELTLTKGDVITDVVTKMDGWWEGVLNGKRGMFPDNFVKVLTSSSQSNVSAEMDFNKSTNNNGGPAGDDSAFGSTNSVNFRKNSTGSVRRLKALFSYSPEQDDELSLAVGDIVEFITEVEEGWWKGQLKGRTGIFPSNFVADYDLSAKDDSPTSLTSQESAKPPEQQIKVERHLPEQPIKDSPKSLPIKQEISEEEPAPKLPPKPIREVARCFYSYTAQNEDELTLKEGDMIYIISKDCEDDGWWRGELRGKTGLFPDNFVKILTPNEPTPPPGPFTLKITAQERSIDEAMPTVKKEIHSTNVVDGVGHSKTKTSFEAEKDVQIGKDTSSAFAKGSSNFILKRGKDVPVVPPQPKTAVTPTSPSSPFGVFLPRLYEKGDNHITRSNSRGKSEEKDMPSDTNDFNSVERGQTLNHPTANRAKPPKRRPPSSPNTRDSDPGVLNGVSHGDFSLNSMNKSLNHSTSMDSSANSSGFEITAESVSSDVSTNSPPAKETTKELVLGSTITKQKMVVPWITELKKKQDKKQVSPGNPSPVHNSSLSSKDNDTVPTSAATRAPPLPAKPVLPPLPTNTSFEKDRPAAQSPTSLYPNSINNGTSNSNAGVVNNKNTASVASKFGGQKKTAATINNSHTSANDGVSPESTKEFVSFEEYSALKDKVTSLESELEIVKKQLKLALDRDFAKGHVV